MGDPRAAHFADTPHDADVDDSLIAVIDAIAVQQVDRRGRR